MRSSAVWRYGGRAVGLLGALLTAVPPNRLSAQVSLHLSAGARYTSTLVHDSIVTPFDVRPALAPALALRVATPLDQRWSADATLDLSWSALERHERDGTSVDLGNLTTLAFAVGLRRWLAAGFSARAGIGGLKYLPAEESGVFRQGSGTLSALGTLGMAYAPRFGARHSLALEARYDLHRFITPALRSEGFTESRIVHRVTVFVSAGLGTAP